MTKAVTQLDLAPAFPQLPSDGTFSVSAAALTQKQSN